MATSYQIWTANEEVIGIYKTKQTAQERLAAFLYTYNDLELVTVIE